MIAKHLLFDFNFKKNGKEQKSNLNLFINRSLLHITFFESYLNIFIFK